MRQKPSWDNAPEWAKYLAEDFYGWAWYEQKPGFRGGLWVTLGKSAIALPVVMPHMLTLEERPT